MLLEGIGVPYYTAKRVSRVSYKGEHIRGLWSTEQDLVLGIKSGLRDTGVSSRVYIQGEV
jgi:hypothetical protein